MKKIFFFLFIIALLVVFANPVFAANSLTTRLKGRLLLQTEDHGRVWYVDPVGLQKHEVTFANALTLFQELALGITNADLNKIPINSGSVSEDLDTDHDGFSDKSEAKNGYHPEIASNPNQRGNDKVLPYQALMNRLRGRLLLQTEDRGRIWYVDLNGTRWEVTWGNLMSLFTKLALGIKNADLYEVGEWQTYHNTSYGFELKLPDTKKITANGNVFTISEDSLSWTISIYPNENKQDLERWLGYYLNQPYNANCQIQTSNLKFGNYYSLLYTASSLMEACADGGYYVINSDKSKVAMFSFGHDPGERLTEILASFKFINSSVNWQSYRNEEYGFVFQYPAEYSLKASADNLIYLINASNNALITFDVPGQFNLETIKNNYAPTGSIDAPKDFVSGKNTFYYYGPGGGGVNYPDRYFYNLNGQLLVITFDGPYINDKTPSQETKQLEAQMLSTLKFIN